MERRSFLGSLAALVVLPKVPMPAAAAPMYRGLVDDWTETTTIHGLARTTGMAITMDTASVDAMLKRVYPPNRHFALFERDDVFFTPKDRA